MLWCIRDFNEAPARKLKSTNEIRPSNKREIAQNAATNAHVWPIFLLGDFIWKWPIFKDFYYGGNIHSYIFLRNSPFSKSSYMAFFPCHLKTFPYNFQRKKIIRNTWKIKLYICPPDSSAFWLLGHLHNERIGGLWISREAGNIFKLLGQKQ